MKKALLYTASSILFLSLSACGGGSSSSGDSSNDNQSDSSGEKPKEPTVLACPGSGTANVTVPLNGKCSNKGTVAVCNADGSKVTVGGALSGKTVTLNNVTYQCASSPK